MILNDSTCPICLDQLIQQPLAHGYVFFCEKHKYVLRKNLKNQYYNLDFHLENIGDIFIDIADFEIEVSIDMKNVKTFIIDIEDLDFNKMIEKIKNELLFST